jgi:hypothetical protein
MNGCGPAPPTRYETIGAAGALRAARLAAPDMASR